MRKILFILIILVPFQAQAQIYDLTRTIKHSGMFTDDSAISSDFISTGTMEIKENKIIRMFHTCEYGICKDFVLNDEILTVDPAGFAAFIYGDSGELVVVRIISLNPSLIIMQQDSNNQNFRIDEYKLRQ